MIPADHQHVWQPYAVRDLGDGRRIIDSRCQCSAATVEDPGTIMEHRLTVDADGRALKIMFRFGGLWLEPLDILRMAPSVATGPIAVCPQCAGLPPAIQGLGPCDVCNGVAVTVGGEAIVAPELVAYPSRA